MTCNHLEYIVYDELKWCKECGTPMGEYTSFTRKKQKPQHAASCEGKTFFESKADIRHWIKEKNSNLSFYKCNVCNGFHLTAGTKYTSIK